MMLVALTRMVRNTDSETRLACARGRKPKQHNAMLGIFLRPMFAWGFESVTYRNIQTMGIIV